MAWSVTTCLKKIKRVAMFLAKYWPDIHVFKIFRIKSDPSAPFVPRTIMIGGKVGEFLLLSHHVVVKDDIYYHLLGCTWLSHGQTDHQALPLGD
jgi:hypothetical protein